MLQLAHFGSFLCAKTLFMSLTTSPWESMGPSRQANRADLGCCLFIEELRCSDSSQLFSGSSFINSSLLARMDAWVTGPCPGAPHASQMCPAETGQYQLCWRGDGRGGGGHSNKTDARTMAHLQSAKVRRQDDRCKIRASVGAARPKAQARWPVVVTKACPNRWQRCSKVSTQHTPRSF